MTIYGWDASHYDQVPDGARVVAEGFSFMTHKAGGDADDAELAAWWSALKPYRDQVLLGAYWVLYPGHPVARADAFLARLDSRCPGWRDGPFILQLDCEIWNGDSSTRPGLGDIRAACDRLKAQMPKLTPIVYASAGQYGNSLSGLGYPLWNARYPLDRQTGTASGLYARCGGDSGSGWANYSGQVAAIWQFTSAATIAGQTTCDANAYPGTPAQLTALLAPGWDNEMDLTPKNLQDIAAAVHAYELEDPYDTATPKRTVTAGGFLRYTASRNLVDPRLKQADGLAKAFTDFAAKPGLDVNALVSGILAGLAAPTRSAADIAHDLVAVLGDQAPAVAEAILAQHPAA